MKILRIVIFLMFFGLCLPNGKVLAFFPDTSKVINNVHNSLDKLDSWKVEVTFPQKKDLKVTVWQRGQDWRQEWAQSNGNSTTVLLAAIGQGENLIESFPQDSQFPLPLTWFWYRPSLERWWSDWGIDLASKSYQFRNHTPCLVLGADYGQMDRTQVWLNNETYIPVRLHGPRGIIWQWKDYRSIGNFPLPHSGTVLFSSGREVDIHLHWPRVNTEISSIFFSEQIFQKEFLSVEESFINPNLVDFLKLNLPQTETP